MKAIRLFKVLEKLIQEGKGGCNIEVITVFDENGQDFEYTNSIESVLYKLASNHINTLEPENQSKGTIEIRLEEF